MIEYTIEELKKLGDILTEDYNKPLLNLPNIKEIGLFNYNNLIDHILKEKNYNIVESLMELIGAYEFAVNDENSYIRVYNFLFKVPLSEMNHYLISNQDEDWKKTIAKWRLLIKK